MAESTLIEYPVWKIRITKMPLEDWREFVASRQNPEFLETSQANRERQAKNKYPHCLSRGGYRKLERKMMEEELQRMKEASQSDPFNAIRAPKCPPRHKKWKVMR
ncbi:hypothetical protein K1719_042614 [Acacia pycnantha]|nr:hypothetical protein K1719_042614 [Acacia pycnantha]